MTKAPTILQIQERFPTEDVCLEHIMRTRFGERFTCPKCGKEAKYYRVKKRRSYECEHCGNQVYPTAGTPFDKTRTDLRLWFHAMFLFCATRNGVSAKELQRQLGVTYKTAWRMGHEIRKYMAMVDGDGPLGGKGIVEVDKTFVGGKDEKGKDDKTIVMGMAERNGEVVTRVVTSKHEFAVVPHILQNVRVGTRIATDNSNTFRNLKQEGYKHGVVDHTKKEYVRGEIHTNTIESCWLWLKRGIEGTHVWVSPKHLSKYLGEFEFRWNLRHQPHLMFEFLVQAFPRPEFSPSPQEDGQSVA